MKQPLLPMNENGELASSSICKTLETVQCRAQRICHGTSVCNQNNWPKSKSLCSERVATDVHKVLNNTAPDLYENYFSSFDHKFDTRGKGKCLKLSAVKSKNGRKMFAFNWASVYNSLNQGILLVLLHVPGLE